MSNTDSLGYMGDEEDAAEARRAEEARKAAEAHKAEEARKAALNKQPAPGTSGQADASKKITLAAIPQANILEVLKQHIDNAVAQATANIGANSNNNQPAPANKTNKKGKAKKKTKGADIHIGDSDSDVYASDHSDVVAPDHGSAKKKRKRKREEEEEEKDYSATDSADSSQDWEALQGHKRTARRRTLRFEAAAPSKFHKHSVREEQKVIVEPMLNLEDAIATFKVVDLPEDKK